ncbi:MAG TPA: hypothetical protein VEC02_00395 [Nitrososphaerales archaeon]|nr:hypothetical protein [Nitrososphaerales archaeon]
MTERRNEWFLLRRGPLTFRRFVNMMFLPYTLMNVCYVLVGSLLARPVYFDRMGGMALVYFLAVGVGAHALDASAPNRPWGSFLSRPQFLAIAVAALGVSLSIGAYYALAFALVLFPIGFLELFFLLSYNLELFRGRFHTDLWFALSWGFLPVLAGFAVQTGAVTFLAVAGGLFGFLTAYVEIKAARPYKALIREGGGASSELAMKFEAILKGIVLCVASAALLLLVLYYFG